MTLKFVEVGRHIAALEADRVVGTIGAVTEAGGAGLLFPPEIDEGPAGLRRELISAALWRLREAGATFAQVVLPASEVHQAVQFEQVGFRRLTEAICLERPPGALIPAPTARSVAGFAVDPLADRDRIIDLIGRINQGSQDCPELDPLRSPERLWSAHFEQARAHRAKWQRYEDSGKDAGIVLCAHLPLTISWRFSFLELFPNSGGEGSADRFWPASANWATGFRPRVERVWMSETSTQSALTVH